MTKGIGIALLVVVLSGCGYYNTFYNARRAYEKKQYEIAQKKCESILSKKSQQWLHDDALYLQGLISLEKEAYSEALYYFERIHKDFPKSSAAQEARQKIIDIYFFQQRMQEVYAYVKAQYEAEASVDSIALYARVLYLLGYEQELEELTRNHLDSSLQGFVSRAYYFHATKQYSSLTGLFEGYKNKDNVRMVIEELFYNSYDHFLWEKYLKNYENFTMYSVLFNNSVEISDVDAFLNNKIITRKQKITVLEKVLESCLNDEKYLVAKYIVIKIKNLQEGNAFQSDSATISIQLSSSVEQLYDQPSDWKFVFTNGTFYYLFTEKKEIYKVVKKKWERQATLNLPPTLSPDTFIYWDSTFQRWIFFEPDMQQGVVNVLYFADMKWDTIRLDNNIPLFSHDSFYVFQNSAYVFYSNNKILKVSLESERIVADYLEIGGYIPTITGYTTLYLPAQGVFILIGGKIGDANNPLAYSLFVNSPSPQWSECFPSMTVDWNMYIIKPLYTSSGTLVMLWKSENQTQSGNKELFQSYSITFRAGIVDIKESFPALNVPIDVLDYRLINHRYVPLVYYYKDSKTTFSNIKIVRATLSFTQSPETGTQTVNTVMASEMLYKSKYNYNTLPSVIDALAIVASGVPRNNRKLGDIYLYDLKLPQKALELYIKDYELSNSSSVLYAIGYIYFYYIRDLEKASEYWQKFLNTKSEDELLRERAQEFLKILKKD